MSSNLLQAVTEHTEALQGMSDAIDPLIEANTKDGLVPDSYLDDSGVRHATVWELGLPERMRLIKTKEGWQLIDRPIF